MRSPSRALRASPLRRVERWRRSSSRTPHRADPLDLHRRPSSRPTCLRRCAALPVAVCSSARPCLRGADLVSLLGFRPCRCRRSPSRLRPRRCRRPRQRRRTCVSRSASRHLARVSEGHVRSVNLLTPPAHVPQIAAHIKRDFDKRYGPTWHVVVGKSALLSRSSEGFLPGRSTDPPFVMHRLWLLLHARYVCTRCVGAGARESRAASKRTDKSGVLTSSRLPAETGHFLYWYMGNIAIVRHLLTVCY